MKNILFLIVDAMSDAYTDINSAYSPTPFIDSLKRKGVYCSNVYSQGPYTEAALTPFYTGRDNLDNGGNFYRGDEVDKTTFEYLSEAGYDVLSYTQPLIYPHTTHRGINEERYGVSYFISALWDYRLNYYKNLYENSTITDDDYKRIIKLLDSNFEFSFQNIKDYKEKNSRFDFINKFAGPYDTDKYEKILLEEFAKYNDNKIKYIESLFAEGINHSLFSIEKIDMNNKANNDDIYKEVKEKYHAFFKKVATFNKQSKTNNENNFFHTCFHLLKSALKFDKGECKAFLKKYYYFRRLCSTKKELDKMFVEKSNYKPEPSFMRYYEHFKWWLNERKSDKPFFCMMHVSDLHTPEIFFSIDSINLKEVEYELDILSSYLDTIPRDFKGNIIYLLSERFVDLCVERIIKDLFNDPVNKDTVIMLSADHGSSFRLWPLRESIVNNLHFENYKIPFVVYNFNDSSFINDNFYTTKDMMKTVLAVANIDNELPGKNVLDNTVSEYMITEYLGGGCPDIYRKDILFAYRDVNYAIFAKQPLNAKNINVFAVYDKKNDYFETHNVLKTVDQVELNKRIAIMANRLENIKYQVDNYKFNL